MRNVTKDLDNRFRVKSRAIGSDSTDSQPSDVKGELEATKEPRNVLVRRIVIEDVVDETPEVSVVNDRQDAERTVVQFHQPRCSRRNWRVPRPSMQS